MTEQGEPTGGSVQPGGASAPDPDWWLASDGKWYPPHLAPGPSAPPPAAPASTRSTTGPSITVWVGLGGALVGSFLPWARAGIITMNGTEGDGMLTLIGAVVAGAFFLRHERMDAPRLPISPTAASVLVLVGLIYIYDLVEVSSLVDDSAFFTVEPGSGLYIGTLGTIVAIVGLVIRASRRRSAASG